VVQRPVAAIKELLENSLDAGATTISVIVKHGGLELIQIQDNGHGIRKEDLEIVCERFTTSKLSSFDDLKSITTYGFRGEALASMTHVARVTITTRTKESACAYRAKYCDGKLVSSSGLSDKPEIKPTAGIIGTTISVEDLFYNMPTRKQAFKNASDEYQRILDVIAKYSIHFGDSNISFACKKHGKASADFFAPPSSSTLENIRLAYGIQVATDLLDVAYKSNSEELKFSMSGKVSKANYAGKKLLLILFINNRLVESSAIKKVIDAAYQDIIPKHSYPFVYLSIG
jgi:DNA mismatch repair protein MLH1